MTAPDANQIAEYLRLNPDATTPEVLGVTHADPSVWADILNNALATDEPHRALETPDTDAPDGGSRGENPTLEVDKPASTTSNTPDTDGAALTDALEWFHQQLDRDLPEECGHDTPRDYYRDGRGWDADTIDEKLLGYAPANHRDELVEYLFTQGYSRERILATGLFGERDDGNLYATWSGRYVLPYFDAEGRPAFAISRATDPVHPADWKGNKYDKLPVRREDVTAKEPIYGLDTVREGAPVLITEGIADAITAHEAGYPCLSPVTVQFKKSDREDLLEALAERDVGRVYLIQDAERPTSDVDDRNRLTLQQFGDGVKGAVKTAAYLSDHGLEARVADLPRPGLEKVDLDDYLQGWSHDLTPLLASAKPVNHHPAYDPGTARDVALDAAEASAATTGPVDGDGTHSALFDLDIRDVTGLSWDYRGPNPLGHHGESENYCVLLEDHDVAYDHKYKVAYNALTYLLADAGERRPASPNGRLDDGEVFAAWLHAKRERFIPDDDPIPHRALQHVARERDLMEEGDLMDGWKLPREAYNAALATVRGEYGVDPGRGDISAGEREHTAVLPAAVRDLTTAASGWNWKHADRGGDTLTVDDARERTVGAIADAYTRDDRVLVEALPTMGKSYGAVKAAADTDEPVTILTGRGHKEQYEQFREWCDEHGLDYYTLPSFTRDCDTANGEHGEEWADTVRGWYTRGATPKEIHKSAEYVLDRPLPCQEHDGQRCPYASKWEFDPDDYDVLIGHYNHAHKAKVATGRTVVFDEFPGAYETLLGPELQGAVSYWLTTTDGVPFDDYTDLSYSGIGDDVLQHMREHDTLQAAMRFGRDGNGAVVYVHTDTLPEWVPLAGEGRVLTTWSDGMRDVVDALEDLTTATTADVVDHPAVDLSRRQVFDHLDSLRERGVLDRAQDTEDGRRVVWRDDGLYRLGEHGEVALEDLAEEEVAEVARSVTYTWEFRNLTAEAGAPAPDTSLGAGAPPRAPANGGDRPPDDAD